MAISRFLVAATFAFVVTGPAGAQDDPNNAARYYRAAFERHETIPESDWDLIWAYFNDPNAEPPQGLRSALSRARPMLADLERAASKPYVDWDLDYDKGFEMLLPHLASMRGLAKVMRAQIVLDLHDGRNAEAASGIATLYRLAAHASTDRTLISSLVGQAIYAYADDLTQVGLDHRAFEGVAAQRLARGHSVLEHDDPFMVIESIGMEQELAASWIEAKLGTAEDRMNIQTLDWIEADDEQATHFAEMSDDDFQSELADYDNLMNDVAAAFSDPDPEAGKAALDAIHASVEAGEHGVFVQLLMPAFGRVFDGAQRMEKMVDERAELLAGLAAGTEDPTAHANAVPYYMSAAHKLEQLGATVAQELGADPLVALRARDFDAAAPLEADAESALAALLARSAEIVATVREGTEKERCDFEYLHRAYHARLCAPYAADLRDLARLLNATTHRTLASGEDVVAPVETMYRFASHLGLDGHYLVACTAHETFLDASAVARTVLAGRDAEDPARRRLYRAADTVSRRDPFGYLAATDHLRRTVGSLPYAWRADGATEEQIAAFQAAVLAWSADELLDILVAFDTLVRTGQVTNKVALEGVEVSRPEDLSRVADILDAAQLAAARGQAVELDAALRRSDTTVMDDRVVPMPAGLELRRARARGDVRDIMAVLRPRGEVDGSGS